MLRRRRAAEADWAETAVQDGAAGHHAAEDEETGWQSSVAGLSGMARLARFGIWVVIAAGPLLGTAALLSSASPSQGATKTAPQTRQASDTGPAGFAQLFVAAYLEAGEGTEKNLAPYYAGSVALTHDPGTRTATRTAAIGSHEISPGYWSVTVAASIAAKTAKDSYRDAGVQYYRVAVQAIGPRSAGGATDTGSQVGYTAVSLPAQVAAPEALTPGGLGYGTSAAVASRTRPRRPRPRSSTPSWPATASWTATPPRRRAPAGHTRAVHRGQDHRRRRQLR